MAPPEFSRSSNQLTVSGVQRLEQQEMENQSTMMNKTVGDASAVTHHVTKPSPFSGEANRHSTSSASSIVGIGPEPHHCKSLPSRPSLRDDDLFAVLQKTLESVARRRAVIKGELQHRVQVGRNDLAFLGHYGRLSGDETEASLVQKFEYLSEKSFELNNALACCQSVFGILKNTLSNLILDERQMVEELAVMDSSLRVIGAAAGELKDELERKRSFPADHMAKGESILERKTVDRDETSSERSFSSSSSSPGSAGLDCLISAIDNERRKRSSESDETIVSSPSKQLKLAHFEKEPSSTSDNTTTVLQKNITLEEKSPSPVYSYGGSGVVSPLVKIKVRTLTQQQLNKMSKSDRKMPYQCLVCKKRYQSAPGLRYHYNSTNHGVVASTLARKHEEQANAKSKRKGVTKKKKLSDKPPRKQVQVIKAPRTTPSPVSPKPIPAVSIEASHKHPVSGVHAHVPLQQNALSPPCASEMKQETSETKETFPAIKNETENPDPPCGPLSSPEPTTFKEKAVSKLNNTEISE